MRLFQSTKETARQDASAFALPIWVGSVGGSALATDPNPNTTPPSNGRILRATPRPGAMGFMNTGSIRLMFGVVAASSITWQPWTYDDTLGRWYEFVNPQTTTPTGAVTNVAVLNMLWVPGSKWFIQITANTLVQCMGYGWG